MSDELDKANQQGESHNSHNPFDKNSSKCLKGIAIIMLLFHHSFGSSTYFEGFPIVFYPFSQTFIVDLAYTGKTCVAIFAFISGYGLWLSRSKSTISSTKWFFTRYFRAFSSYWFVYLLAFIVTLLVYHMPYIKYFKDVNVFIGIKSLLIDILGLANLFGTPTLNRTWWYMSAAFVFILFFSLIPRKSNHNLILLFILIIVFPRLLTGGNSEAAYTGQNSPMAFLPAALLGAVFAEYSIFEKFEKYRKTEKKPVRFLRFTIELLILMVCYKAYLSLPYNSMWEIHFAFIPLVFIMFCIEYVVTIPGVNRILFYLGRHSTNIFLTHTFLSGTFFHRQLYSLKYYVIIVLALLISSLFISIVIELLKRISRYNMLFTHIEKKLEIL